MERIEGLSIGLNLDTMNLNSGLTDLKSKLKTVNSEMNANLAAFDRADRSVEKHQTIIDGLNKKLTIQQTITEKARKSYEKMVAEHGEGSKEAEKAAREYNNQSTSLQNLQRSIQRNEGALQDLQKEQREATSGWGKMDRAMKNTGSSLTGVGDKLKGIGSTMSLSVTAPLVGGFVALTKGTEEFRGDLAKLETNAEQAGLGVDTIRKSMERLSGVSDETDSNVEALSNLLEVDFSEKGLTKTIDALSGAVVKFPDTLKIEGLADGLQETLATGKAIGPFAEMLDRLGVNTDKFNDGLAEAIKKGEEENFILKTLADTGLADVNEAYRNNNKELIESQEASQKFQQATADLGRTLTPIMTSVTEIIAEVTEKFNELEPSTQKNVLVIGGLAAAIGPLVSGLGFTVAGVGAFITALGAAALPVAATVGIIAGLGAGFLALDHEMDKPIIKSDIFAGKISEATEKAVGSYMKLDEDATAELNSLAWSSQTITDEMANNMITKYQAMGDQILTAMKENHNQQLAEQQRLFTESDILTEEEEAKRIAKLKANQLKEEEAHNANQARIKEIWTLAAEEKRGITDAEAKEIAKLQNQSRLKAVEELSKSKEEQETILRNLKTNKGIIETETAAKTVAKSIETRDKVVKEANKEYKQKVAAAESARDELGILKPKEADAIIKEAERARNKVVTKAQDMHYDVVKEAKGQSGDHVDEVNWETGQVLSGWDSMYNGVLKAVNWVRGLFGKGSLSKKGTVKETGRQKQRRQDAEFKPAYAIGTPSTGHPGGPAIVGEEGMELAHIPGKGVTLLGTKGPELLSNLPKGSSVLPNIHTERMLKSYGFPGYAEGIGDYFDLFLKGTGSVWNKMKDKFSLSDSVIPSWIRDHTGSPLSYVKDMATSWVKGLWDNWFDDNGGGGAQAPNFGGSFRRTSGFGQRWGRLHGGVDYAAPIGTPIPSQSGGVVSFASNGWNGGFGNLVKVKQGMYEHFYAHMSRIMTKVGQQVSKGSILGLVGSTGDSTGPHVHYELRKNGMRLNPGNKGFATGGLINKAGLYPMAEEGHGEWVISRDPKRRTDAMKLLALAGKDIQGNKRPNQLPNATATTNNDSLINALLEQNQYLKAIVQSIQSIERKPVISEGDIGRATDRYESNEIIKHAIFSGGGA